MLFLKYLKNHLEYFIEEEEHLTESISRKKYLFAVELIKRYLKL